MSPGKPTKSASAWLNDWRVHVASGAVLLLVTVAVLASKRIGGENRRAAQPMNPTHGARLDDQFVPQSHAQPAAAPTANPPAFGSIQRGVPTASATGTSVPIDLDAGWLSELPAVAAPSSDTQQPPVDSLQLIPGQSLALAIELAQQSATAQPLAIQIGSTELEIRTTDGQSAFVCRGQALGKLPVADGKLVLLIHREPAEPGDAAAGVLRWVLAAGDSAVAGRVELDGLEPSAAIAFDSQADDGAVPTIAAARFGNLPHVPDVAMPPVRFSR